MKYNGVIEAKLRVVEEKLLEIESWQIDSFSTFKASSLLQNAVERALQVIIEAIIDTGERILALEKEPATTSSSVLSRLQEMGMISEDKDYMEMVRFRNFIVHRYEKIDLEIVYSILKNKLPLFRKFIHDIRHSCS
ncbi:MAG: DUF86 domain-containing protein [Prevotellaceae bacterium]|jgi:uncharacterized protein YutE (UPF0331/DUF86 family)|nr:DUF86 domain-containing protein [Prevotellaceae bacterium]